VFDSIDPSSIPEDKASNSSGVNRFSLSAILILF
jgi:hypothetical protein